jgi:hypothetical protein
MISALQESKFELDPVLALVSSAAALQSGLDQPERCPG